MRHLHNPDQPSDPLDTVHVSGATACEFCQDAPDLPADYRLNLSQGVAQRLRGAIANLLPRQAPYADFVQAICAQAADEASRLRLLRALDVPGLFSAFHEGRCAASCEYRQIDAAGKIAWVLLAIRLAQDAKSGDILGRLSIRNIDERKKQELSLGEKVTRDPLTDLYDQAGTETMIDNLIGSKAKAKTLSALFLIAVEVADGRLKLSDGKLLCDVASTLNACFVSEAIIGHMGHGQFVVFLADAHTDTQALSFAQAATQKLLSLPHREKNRPTLSASTGIALAQAPLASYPVLLSHARQAMRNAAKQGCNRCMRYDAESGCAQDAAYAQQNHSLLIDALDYAVMVLDLPDVKLRYVNRYVSRHATAEQQRLLIAYSQHLARRNLDFLQSAPDESAFEAYQATECLFRFKPILWNGRRACLMLAVERTHPLLSTGADLHDPLLKLLDQLNRASDDRSAIQAVLSCLGELYAPDHAYFLGCATSAQLGDTHCVWDDPTAPVHEAASEDARAAIEDWLRGSTLPGMMLNDASGQSEAPGLTCAMDALGVRALYYAQDASHQARATRLIYLTNPKRHLGSLSLLLGAMPLLCARLTQFEQANQLEFLAGHDALTGLGNRLCYTRTLDQLNPESLSSLGIVSVDVNNLNLFNLQSGNGSGDKLLQTVAQVLKDTFYLGKVFRISGDEFVVLDIDVSYNHFRKRLTEAQAQFDLIKPDIVAMASLWEKDNIHLGDMLHRIAQMLSLQKQRFYDSAESQLRTTRGLLRTRLARHMDAGEFVVYLQPKARTPDLKVVGAEALCRMVLPDGHLIGPGKFIPILEENGLIPILDFYMFDRTLAQIGRWQRQGAHPGVISINCSRATMLDPDLIPRLSALCAKHSVAHHAIEIEVTETLGAVNQETLAAVSDNLIAAGFLISLDDFGSRYSSLSILATMNVHTVKLDKSLIDLIAINRRALATARSVIDFCQGQGLHCVAEGVETQEQLALLCALKCELIQGYLINKPLPITLFEKRHAEFLQCPESVRVSAD